MVIHRGLEMVKGQAAAWLASQQEAEVPVATDELDADPYLLNCENGILDLRTGRLRPHNRDDMMTYLAPTVYDAEADMTDWIEFVEWACQGDQEQVRWLQIMLGQALIGKVETHTMLFFYGPGANGKTQLTDAIGLTIGDYGASAPVELITARGKDQLHTESMASIRGRRFIVCPEPEKNAHWNDGRLKRLTGGDVVKARHLYGREFEFKPQCLLVVHGNHQPEIRDITGGFQRRIRLVPFEAVIQQHQMVPELGRKLAGPGVLRWLAEGAKAWIDRPRVPPSQRIERASSEYISEQHQMKRWKEDMTLRTDPTDKAAWETSTDLYATYIFWCKQNGIRFVETLQALINYLVNEEGFVRTIRTDGGSRRRGIAGIKIIQAPAMDTM
jgi:putative DNA primase/helicase